RGGRASGALGGRDHRPDARARPRQAPRHRRVDRLGPGAGPDGRRRGERRPGRRHPRPRGEESRRPRARPPDAPGAPRLTAAPEEGLEHVAAFGTALRAAGLRVGTGRLVGFSRAAAALPPSELYWAGRVTLVSRREDLAVYDRAFRDHFGAAP